MNSPKTYLWILLLLPLLSLGQYDSLRMRQSLVSAATFLEKAQLPSGAICDSANPLFNTWETILATDALLGHYPETHPTIARALLWLSSNTNSDGLVCHNSACRDSYCIETTCLYLQLLNRLDEQPPLNRRIALLEELQGADGSWKVGNPDVVFNPNYVSVTAFMLNLFQSDSHVPKKGDAAFRYIIAQQEKNGSWGQTWEYYDCPGYALWQCMPALWQEPAYRSAYEQAKNYILTTQLENGSWYTAEAPERHHVSAQLQTALMLTCLLWESDETSRRAVVEGLRFLMDTQLESGAWDGGLFPIPNQRYTKREYIFATALICKLLSTLQPHGDE
jgi:hypothetical protein